MYSLEFKKESSAPETEVLDEFRFSLRLEGTTGIHVIGVTAKSADTVATATQDNAV